jgi:hypothetical protein
VHILVVLCQVVVTILVLVVVVLEVLVVMDLPLQVIELLHKLLLRDLVVLDLLSQQHSRILLYHMMEYILVDNSSLLVVVEVDYSTHHHK